MPNFFSSRTLIVFAALSVGECASPLLTYIGYAATVGDGVSYARTGRSMTDNAVSGVTGKDCMLWRVIDGKKVCKDWAPLTRDQMADLMLSDTTCIEWRFDEKNRPMCINRNVSLAPLDDISED